MLKEQILALEEKEIQLTSEIIGIEEALKNKKMELGLIKKAKQQLEKLEEQLNGQSAVSA